MVDEAGKESMEQIVEREMREKHARVDARVHAMGIIDTRMLATYLNNFFFNLPSSLGSSQNEVELTRARRSTAKNCEKYVELYTKLVDEESSIPYCVRLKLDEGKLLSKGHSVRFIHHTKRTFDEDVKLAIRNANLDIKVVESVVDKFYSSTKILDQEYRDVILPVYIELRKIGYTYMDLT